MKISVNDKVKVKNALDLTQKRCSVRMISLDDIPDIIEETERHMSTIMYKKDWKGVSVTYRFGSSFAGSYNGIPMSTSIELLRGATCWFIISLCRERCRDRPVLSFKHLLDKNVEIVKYVSLIESEKYIN